MFVYKKKFKKFKKLQSTQNDKDKRVSFKIISKLTRK